MSSISFDSDDDDICVVSIPDVHDASKISSSAEKSYTPEQLKQFLLKKDHNFRLENNESKKALAPWWRSFGYVTVKNK